MLTQQPIEGYREGIPSPLLVLLESGGGAWIKAVMTLEK